MTEGSRDIAFIRECVTRNPGGYTDEFKFILSLIPEPSAEADEDGWRSVSESEWQAVVEYRRSREPSAEAPQYTEGYVDGIRAALAEPSAEADAALYLTDGLVGLIDTLLRKYGGTMKGRGDHDIYDSLVRFRKQTKEYRDRRLATGGGQEGAGR